MIVGLHVDGIVNFPLLEDTDEPIEWTDNKSSQSELRGEKGDAISNVRLLISDDIAGLYTDGEVIGGLIIDGEDIGGLMVVVVLLGLV